MKIADIDRRLIELRDATLAEEFDIPEQTLEEIDLAPPPDADMGDVGFPCFQLAPHLKKPPPEIAGEVAEALRERAADFELVDRIEATGPYVNFTFEAGRLSELVVTQALGDEAFGADFTDGDQRWMIEFSAPNTNKPQHLGHVRNDLLGASVASLIDFSGHDCLRTNLINDRGIHISKSMVAYQADDDAPIPEEVGQKGDHFVGDYYVKFNEMVEAEYDEWKKTEEAEQEFEAWLDQEREADRLPDDLGEQRDQLRQSFFETFEDDYFNEYSELGARARQMLQRWEDGDEEVHELWETMNTWVLDGFDATYERLGVEFDDVYFESETYERGRQVVEQGLDDGIFERLDDGAVAFDLDTIGLDGEKILLRADGTTVYMTQDLGTAYQRFEDHDPDRMIYVTGDEQNYHFEVLFGILSELDPQFDGRLHHLSYGMVDLPEGKMKSREGKVVEADDLMDEMNT
ncbi:MAG: arginine--tRNA ligase, partial [Bradymonadaceae bacterium]